MGIWPSSDLVLAAASINQGQTLSPTEVCMETLLTQTSPLKCGRLHQRVSTPTLPFCPDSRSVRSVMVRQPCGTPAIVVSPPDSHPSTGQHQFLRARGSGWTSSDHGAVCL